jgi:hypothetical protein
MGRSRGHGRQRIGHRQLAIVVTVNAEGHLKLFADGPRDARHIVRKTAAVCIAEYDPMGAYQPPPHVR